MLANTKYSTALEIHKVQDSNGVHLKTFLFHWVSEHCLVSGGAQSMNESNSFFIVKSQVMREKHYCFVFCLFHHA